MVSLQSVEIDKLKAVLWQLIVDFISWISWMGLLSTPDISGLAQSISINIGEISVACGVLL